MGKMFKLDDATKYSELLEHCREKNLYNRKDWKKYKRDKMP